MRKPTNKQIAAHWHRLAQWIVTRPETHGFERWGLCEILNSDGVYELRSAYRGYARWSARPKSAATRDRMHAQLIRMFGVGDFKMWAFSVEGDAERSIACGLLAAMNDAGDIE